MGALKDWVTLGPAKLQALREEHANLEARCRLQALVIDDVTAVTDRDKRYKGNAYPSYSQAVAELAKKYDGTADWGVVQTGNIIDVRAAFISAGGLKIYPKDKKADKAEKEMEFVQRFLAANNLDHEMVQQFAKEGELEGRFLGELFWDEEQEMVMLRYRSWADTQYKITTDERDYTRFTKASWKVEGKDPVTLEEGRFAYAKIAGRVHKAEDTYPKVAKCLTQIEYLDKAIRDWREINRLFAAPVPDFQLDTNEGAAKAKEAIDKINWKTKKALVHTGQFSYKAPDMTGTDSLEREIINLAKMISGTTGTPVHFLGLPDLMSNRATAENLMELVSASTTRERATWTGFYQQVVTKAVAIWNEKSKKTPLEASKLAVAIPYITQETWSKIQNVYLPLYVARAISLEALLAQLPDIDVEDELKRKAERDDEAAAKFAGLPDEEDEDEEDAGPLAGRRKEQRQERTA